ncbi:hypothetical protein [Vibrio sp. 10N.261.55.A7]|nr:hypothetical protein [Vibrio sp. 10N.261.55.A7]
MFDNHFHRILFLTKRWLKIDVPHSIPTPALSGSGWLLLNALFFQHS